ncbi:F1F0 ATP synthase subunit epsilon NDAI_0I02740 [Naumovozyma dairenensis CBS 421]|uniref:ATP synthase subunit epsilon, mitochondrial n=1 Tax=Naumovozyma dairenensis (strain ATCC 10597 / BCRC 20456 / CBS 421 / NBRC 0211 / NRRL Y-12639) TaxID=1071378 RepID=G0WGD1_NAUDC|nr:hypothetical protein NDAI_0I02740 [Naumovozyma dairenensis CBS 421]CCD26842.1 hypothetical protein NDAI_0I02740 [Naumovozyma dairenensis CBS 421]
MSSSAVWRKAGITYSAYLSIAARTLRAALKPELQTATVMARSHTDAYFTKYKDGAPASEPESLQKK